MIEAKIYPPTHDFDFLIKATTEEYHCEFVCYQCDGWVQGPDDAFNVPTYHIKSGKSSSDWTENFAEAQPYLSGSIKWDGCANLRFDEQDEVMLHFCGRRSAQQVGRLLDRIYDLAAELIPTWNAEVAA